jgi:hypothetical protein
VRAPADDRSPVVEEAVRATTGFLLGHDIARAAYPFKDRISSSWFKFGYPMGYVTDVLLNLQTLVEVGLGGDPRLSEAVRLVLSKQDEMGRWRMEYSLNGKMWADIEVKGKPSKWVTLRALRMLKGVSESGGRVAADSREDGQ